MKIGASEIYVIKFRVEHLINEASQIASLEEEPVIKNHPVLRDTLAHLRLQIAMGCALLEKYLDQVEDPD